MSFLMKNYKDERKFSRVTFAALGLALPLQDIATEALKGQVSMFFFIVCSGTNTVFSGTDS